ncbi:hydroxyacid dehydrogenase [uncultured Streptomyces sp.]|uniref:hydroxyacid dehydrogenase n=1 Tax=uncultured Streptomyces sp. TaxID=174707 RepID=UPI002617BD66|nr:hydroxyacid dehydrogenase [uncultured Streptomyces sp.]
MTALPADPAADAPLAPHEPSRPRVLLAMDPEFAPTLLSERTLTRLARIARCDTRLLVQDLTDPAVRAALADAEVLLTFWGCPPLDEAVLAAAPKLRAVVHAAGSVRGHVPAHVWDRGIQVSSAASANALPVAEYTVACVLFFNKHVLEARDAYRRVRGHDDWRSLFTDVGNYRRTVGIVGASRIGRRVMELLRPYALDVLVHDPYLSATGATELGVRAVDLDTLCAESDVVSLHAPELPSTLRMIDRRRLALMRDGATFINTARGALVDQDALTAELVAGRLRAVIDVTVPEVLPSDSPLYDLPNVLLTPHFAGSFGNEVQRMADSALDEIARFARGLPFSHPVRREELDHLA